MLRVKSSRPLTSPYTLIFFFFNDTATTEIYTLSLHDALPILESCCQVADLLPLGRVLEIAFKCGLALDFANRSGIIHRDIKPDRKSTRLNSSHANISYAVFCLKKKKSMATNSVYEAHLWRPTA